MSNSLFKIQLFVVLIFTTLSGYSQSKTLTKQIATFDAYTENAMNQWGAVGMAVAVVKDNEVIFTKGYGLRELNTQDKVDTNTLFACASTTKAMVATCMGVLVDEGKISWSDHVSDYLPEFQLYDPYVTRELTIRDLFIHDSGVGNTDFLWSMMNISSEEVLAKMKYVKPTYSFRSSFIYQNIFYLAAGKVIEKVSGQPWNQFIQQRIFSPLGMVRTFPRLQDVKDANKTKPHFKVNGKIEVIEDLSADAIGPAGAVWSSITDMATWTQCMLDSGKYKGGRLVNPETWIEMTKVQTLVPPAEFYPTARLTKPNWTTYGMGWFQHDYKGKKINYHTGSLSGSIAIHGQIPEAGIAIYVFGNTDHVEVRHALMYKAFDLFALGGTTDWSTDLLALYTSLNTPKETAPKDLAAEKSSPSLPLTEYAGKYIDKLYGEIIVTVKGEQLELNINNFLKATLNHLNYDTFKGPFEKAWIGESTAQFQLDFDGEVASINFEGLLLKKEK